MASKIPPRIDVLQRIDALIERVKRLPVASRNAGAAAGGIGHGRPAGIAFSDEKDVAWFPEVPPGHTTYTWSEGADVKQQHAAPPGHTEYTWAHQNKPGAATTAEAPKQAPAKQEQKNDKAAAAPKKGEKSEKTAEKTEGKQEKGGKKGNDKAKPAEAAKPAAAAAPESNQPVFTRLDFRVGHIVKAWKHPNADKMWVEEIDLGEGKPRQICSGLVEFVPLERMNGANVVVVSNLKASDLRGVMSFGMVLAASSDDHKKVDLVQPPQGSKPGDRLFLKNATAEERLLKGEVDINGRDKASAWAIVAPDLKTDASGLVTYKGVPLVTEAGPAHCPSMPNSNVR